MRDTVHIHSKQPIDDVSDGRCKGTSLCNFGSGKWVNPRAIKKPLTDLFDLFGGTFERFFDFFPRVNVQKSQAIRDLLDLDPIIQPAVCQVGTKKHFYDSFCCHISLTLPDNELILLQLGTNGPHLCRIWSNHQTDLRKGDF